ncbi:MAG: GNAT family N-acetyltransferase [Gaiella sp.]
MHELELIADRAFASIYRTDAVAVAGATCCRMPSAPESPMLNRVTGLGLGRPATDADLDAVLEAMTGTTFYVAISPFAAPADLGRRLERRGLEPGWGWMLFERDARPPRAVETALRVVEADDADAIEAWARIVRTAYGLPEGVQEPLCGVARLPAWTALLALEGSEPAAAAGMWIEGENAYLGFAGTLPEHRGKGGQAALFSERIERARAHGCARIVTETGEQLPDRPSSSYRNILRAGFEERYVVAHRLGRA